MLSKSEGNWENLKPKYLRDGLLNDLPWIRRTASYVQQELPFVRINYITALEDHLKSEKEKVILNKNNQHFDAVNKVLAPKA